MLIALDIGNTSVTYGLYDGQRLKTHGTCLFNAIPNLMTKWTKSGTKGQNNILISSVVPKNTKKIKQNTRFKKWGKLWIAGQNLPVPLKHHYKDIHKLGIDRAVSLYGAGRLYGTPLLLFDYGTAITVDYLSAKGIFKGGMIIPGPELAFHALIDRAALIPKKIRLPHKRGPFLGRDTRECMDSGILEAYGAMSEALVERFRKRYGKSFKIVATGGFARHLKPYSRAFEVVDPLLPVKSLYLLYQQERSKREKLRI